MAKKNVCPCGEIVRDRTYCSKNHRELYGKTLGRPKTLVKLCPCGKALERDSSSRYTSKFCSDDHKMQFSKSIPGKKKNPDNFETKTCLNCDKHWEWRIGSGKGKYCSTKCSGESNIKEKQECSFQDCGQLVHALDLCTGHYKQSKNGRPLANLQVRGTKTEFPCGHPRTHENSRSNGHNKALRCATCKREDNLEWQAALHSRWGSDEHLMKLKPQSSMLELDCILLFEPLGYRHNGYQDGQWTERQRWIRDKETGKIKFPDFIKSGERKVLEVFGDYWHQGEDPQDIIDWYNRNGYECEVYWEHEVREMLKEVIPSAPSKMEVRTIRSNEACDLNNQWHSSHGNIHWSNVVRSRDYRCYGAFYNDRPFGTGIWSSPISKPLDNGKSLELRRLAIAIQAPGNSGSWMISKMVKDIKKDFPHIERLLSYSDSDHVGTVYQASGWNPVKKDSGTGKDKIRWERAI